MLTKVEPVQAVQVGVDRVIFENQKHNCIFSKPFLSARGDWLDH